MTDVCLVELRAAGFPVRSIDELRESGERYEAAVPILLNSLHETSDLGALQAIVRALSVPWAKCDALGPMIVLFETLPIGMGPRHESLRWAVGNALYELWDDRKFADFERLVRRQEFGKAREMVALGFSRSKRRRDAREVLVSLMSDPVLSGHALKGLRKMKATVKRESLQPFVEDGRAWVRRDARALLNYAD